MGEGKASECLANRGEKQNVWNDLRCRKSRTDRLKMSERVSGNETKRFAIYRLGIGGLLSLKFCRNSDRQELKCFYKRPLLVAMY